MLAGYFLSLIHLDVFLYKLNSYFYLIIMMYISKLNAYLKNYLLAHFHLNEYQIFFQDSFFPSTFLNNAVYNLLQAKVFCDILVDQL